MNNKQFSAMVCSYLLGMAMVIFIYSLLTTLLYFLCEW